MSEPLAVLFVCTANICRSPWMELTARSLAGDSPLVTFASAGTHGLRAHPMDPDMAATLPPGVSPDGFRSRRLRWSAVEEADLVLTAEGVHRTFVLDDHPQLVRKVFTLGQFAAAAEEDPGPTGRDLVAAAAARRVSARPELDVADPFRRGVAANETAAAAMSTMLSVIVPRLVQARPQAGPESASDG